MKRMVVVLLVLVSMVTLFSSTASARARSHEILFGWDKWRQVYLGGRMR